MDLLRYRDELVITRITHRNGTDPFRKSVHGDSSDGLDWSLDILPVIPKTNSVQPGNHHLTHNHIDDNHNDPRSYIHSLQENHISSLDDDYSGSIDDDCGKSFEEDNKTSIEDESEYTTDMLPAAFCEATVCKEEAESLPDQPDTTGANIVTATATPKQKKFRCNDCNYSTDVSSHFRAHKRRHTGERPYACPLCPYRAAESCTLNRHKLTHSGAKKHLCPLCPYRAFLAGDVAKHMRCHTGERPYSCPLCPYRASRRSSVKEHLATHSLSKEYPCDICGHKCATRIQLRRHVKNKHFLP